MSNPHRASCCSRAALQDMGVNIEVSRAGNLPHMTVNISSTNQTFFLYTVKGTNSSTVWLGSQPQAHQNG